MFPRPKRSAVSKSVVKNVLIFFFGGEGSQESSIMTIFSRKQSTMQSVSRFTTFMKARLSGNKIIGRRIVTKILTTQHFHKATFVQKRIPELECPPYSSDLAPCDLFIPKLKFYWKGSHFESFELIQSNVTKVQKALQCFHAFKRL